MPPGTDEHFVTPSSPKAGIDKVHRALEKPHDVEQAWGCSSSRDGGTRRIGGAMRPVAARALACGRRRVVRPSKAISDERSYSRDRCSVWMTGRSGHRWADATDQKPAKAKAQTPFGEFQPVQPSPQHEVIPCTTVFQRHHRQRVA